MYEAIEKLTREWLKEQGLTLKRITIALHCDICGKEWGVNITDIRELKNRGNAWHVCLNCQDKKLEVRYEQERVTTVHANS